MSDQIKPNGSVPLPEISAGLKYTRLETRSARTMVNVNGISFGGQDVVVIAGPCSVENRLQLFETAQQVREAGAMILRGGAFKPRTSPYSFQGLQESGLELLKEARDTLKMPVVTEVMDIRKVDLVGRHADMLQIGSRNMHNTPLLEEVGRAGMPVLLKRGMSATIEEFLFAAEYILSKGNDQVVLCERGIRTFETSTRFTLDISAIPMLKSICHLPVIADPSHGSGHGWMVPQLAKAAIAAGADGLLIEVHYDPDKALCDGRQSLDTNEFRRLMGDLDKLTLALGRKLATHIKD